jgi:diguanylate cyclase
MTDTKHWRQKYLNSLDELEAAQKGWKALEELLRRMGRRLCVAARGQNPDLDRELTRVSAAMRNAVTHAKLESLLDALTAAIGRLDAQPRAEDAPAFTPAPVPAAPTASATADSSTVRELLVSLLDRLSLSPAIQAECTKLRTQMLEPAAVLGELARRLADLINRHAGNLQRERGEMEQTLQKLNSHLADISVVLGTDVTERRAAREDGRGLDLSLMGEMKELGDNVRQASDLAWLQLRVSSRIESIADQLRQFRNREQKRSAQEDDRTAQLQTRVAELERQSGQLKETLQRERIQALTDPLTSIPNRLAWQERAHLDYERWRSGKIPLCLATWDVDRFKAVNDTYGHQAGDKVLRFVGQHLANAKRKVDFVARYGGEEFVLILDGLGSAEALGCVEILRQGVERLEFRCGGKHVPITISCGLTELRGDDTIDSAFQRADAAMYEAKRAGRNRCVAA